MTYVVLAIILVAGLWIFYCKFTDRPVLPETLSETVREWPTWAKVGVPSAVVVVAVAAMPGTERSTSTCEPVPAELVAAIESGLTVNGGGRLGSAAAVRSDDYEKVWMVAAGIHGPGLDGSAGVWATNRLEGGGSIFAVDGMAKEFSDWGADSNMDFSIGDHGVSEAKACL